MPDGRVETQHLPEMKDDTARVEHAAGTFRRKHGDALTWEDVAQYRSSKVRVGLAIADPERHLGLRVSRLEDLAKGLVVDGHVAPTRQAGLGLRLAPGLTERADVTRRVSRL